MVVGASSRTRASTSPRKPCASAVGWPGSKMPPYTLRPRCSMKAPNRRRFVAPITLSARSRTVTVRIGFSSDSGIHGQHRTLEQLRIGMLRVVEHGTRGALLHHASIAHDDAAVADR